jgi:hypothetical protein
VARHYGVEPWQVRRLFERGLLPEAHRVGAYRVIAVDDLPQVEAVLKAAGYLPEGTFTSLCRSRRTLFSAASALLKGSHLA